MPVKIKGLKKLNKNFKKIMPDARSVFAIEAKKSIVDIIVERIVSGISPVKGFGRYEKYSSGYGKKKGRLAPVDLVRTGDMLNNMRARITNSKDIIIEFTDPLQKKKAAAHNYGQGNMPKRKMFPSKRGEGFKEGIKDKISAMLNKAIKNSLR